MRSIPSSADGGIRWWLHFLVFVLLVSLYLFLLYHFGEKSSDIINAINKYFNPISFIATFYALLLTLLQVREIGARSKVLSEQTTAIVNESLLESARNEVDLIKQLWKMAQLSIDGKNYAAGRLLIQHARERITAFSCHSALTVESQKSIENASPKIGSIETVIDGKLFSKRGIEHATLSRSMSEVAMVIYGLQFNL